MMSNLVAPSNNKDFLRCQYHCQCYAVVLLMSTPGYCAVDVDIVVDVTQCKTTSISMSHCHPVALSYCHTLRPSRYEAITLSCRRALTMSCCRVAALSSCRRAVLPPRCRPVVLP